MIFDGTSVIFGMLIGLSFGISIGFSLAGLLSLKSENRRRR